MSKFTKENELRPSLVRVRRTKKEVAQHCDLYISKLCLTAGWKFPQSKWYTPDASNDPEEYMEYLKSNEELCAQVYELVGQSLGCWCTGKKQKSCHGQILIDETKRFLKDYFKKEKRDIFLKPQAQNKDKLRLEIVPQQPSKTYKLRVHTTSSSNNEHNEHNEHNEYNEHNEQQPTEKLPVAKKIKLSSENQIIWNDSIKQWILPNNLKLTEDMRTPIDARISFKRCESESPHVSFYFKKGSKLTALGKIHYSSLITKPIEIKPRIKHTVPPIDFEKYYTITFNKTPQITQSALEDLYTGKSGKWDPFICRVEARLFHKKSNRYMLKLYDGTALYKVHLGSQLFEMVKQKFVDKGDFIKVIDYAATLLNPRKRIVILHNIKKIVVK